MEAVVAGEASQPGRLLVVQAAQPHWTRPHWTRPHRGCEGHHSCHLWRSAVIIIITWLKLTSYSGRHRGALQTTPLFWGTQRVANARN